MNERIIVFMAGTQHRPTTYYFPDTVPGADVLALSAEQRRKYTIEAKYSPLGVVQLQKQLGIQEYPDQVVVLLTKEAKSELDSITRDFGQLGIDVVPVDIDDGETPQELMHTTEKLLNILPEAANVTIDITHGFRSAPFLFTLAVQYFELVQPSVQIDGLFYAMLKRGSATTPIVDMKVYLEMFDWVYAARVFRDTLLPSELVKLIRRANAGKDRDNTLEAELQRFSTALEAALPLQIGETANALGKTLSDSNTARLDQWAPGGKRLFAALAQVGAAFQADSIPDVLTDDELARQAHVIDSLLEHERDVQAIGLMREWTILKVIRHNEHLQARDRWRDWKAKNAVHSYLGEIHKDDEWPDKRLGEAVEDIRNRRNYYNHYGQSDSSKPFDPLEPDAGRLWDILKSYENKPAAWELPPKG